MQKIKIYKHDPVCGKSMEGREVYVEIRKSFESSVKVYHLCCPECHNKFEENEDFYMKQAERLERNFSGKKIFN